LKPAGRITMRDGAFLIQAPPHVSIRLRRLFGGAQRYKAGEFTLAATPEHAHDLEWFMERHPMEVDPEVVGRFAELVAAQRKKLAAIEAIDTEGYIPTEFELAIPPRAYQRLGADLALKTGSLLLCDSLGTGKTITCICALTAPGVLPAVVVTMTHLTRQWERELARFAPKLRVHRIRSTEPYAFTDVKLEVDPLTKRRKVVRHTTTPDVLLISYSKLHGWADKLASVCRTMIADEAQEFRHEGTRKYKAGMAIAQAVDLRIFATATPIYNYGHEIFHVMDACAPGQLGTWKEFLDEWCGGSADARGRATVYDPAALGSYLRASGLMIRRTRADVGREIPDLTIVRHECECDESSINRVAADVAELARRVLDRIGTGIERMQDARDIDYQMREATGIGKAAGVADLVRMLVDSGEQVVLSGWHHAVYEIYRSHFDRAGAEIPYAMYTGQESDSQKDEARRRFIAGEARILIISNRSGAGLDGLQAVCSVVVVGELDWSPQVIHQLIGRVHRDGQTNKVVAYMPIANCGSDPVIARVLGIKEAQSHYLLNPGSDGMPEFHGAGDDHIRMLAEDVLKRRGQVVDN
jgi:SNF2 family DNA or RNA helicase